MLECRLKRIMLECGLALKIMLGAGSVFSYVGVRHCGVPVRLVCGGTAGLFGGTAVGTL